MSRPYSPEIRHLQSPEDPFFIQARLVSDAAHHYELSWSDIGQHYIAMAPDKLNSIAGIIQVINTAGHQHRRSGYRERHITRLAVDAAYRQRGIGSTLYKKIPYYRTMA